MLIQTGFSNIPIQLLWVVSLILFGLTVVLFMSSITIRFRHKRYESLVEECEKRFYELIPMYLDGEISEEEIQNQFSGRGLEYSVFEKTVFEMLEVLEGQDVEKLQKLLFLSPIFDYHLAQLQSSDTFKNVKACHYFSYTRLVNHKIISRLKSLLVSKNRIVMFSAASALMASNDVGNRGDALYAIASRALISDMALLEMVYKFHNDKENQMEDEIEVLKGIIEDEEIPVESLTLLLNTIPELGYQDMASWLLEKLWSEEERWRHSNILATLIRVQGDFYNAEAEPVLRAFIYYPSADVRASAAYTLGKLGGEENIKALYNLLYDKDQSVKTEAVKGLMENGDEGMRWLEKSYKIEHLETRKMAESIRKDLLGNRTS